MYINKAIVFGNLTRDPELKSLPSGIKVCSLSLATNRTWKDKNGARQEAVDYHNVVVFGKQAETSAQYLKKGSSLFVEGRLQTRSWDATDGTKKYRTEIIADRIQFGPRGTTGGPSGAAPKQEKSAAGTTEEQLATIEYPEEDINPDDIPF